MHCILIECTFATWVVFVPFGGIFHQTIMACNSRLLHETNKKCWLLNLGYFHMTLMMVMMIIIIIIILIIINIIIITIITIIIIIIIIILIIKNLVLWQPPEPLKIGQGNRKTNINQVLEDLPGIDIEDVTIAGTTEKFEENWFAT